MPVAFEILPSLNLVHVRYDGFADLASTAKAAEACSQHPDFQPDLPHYFDLSGATGFEHDFVGFFAMQAKLAEMYTPFGSELFVVFNAPDGPAREMAELARKSWDGVPQIVLRIVQTEAEALALLGLSPTALAEHISPTT